MALRLSPPAMSQPAHEMKNTSIVFAFSGCLALLTFLFVYTKSINVLAIWDAKAYGYLATCAGLMIVAAIGTALLAPGKPATSGVAIAVLLLTAVLTQCLFGFDLYTVMAVGLLYVAAFIELASLPSDTAESPQP